MWAVWVDWNLFPKDQGNYMAKILQFPNKKDEMTAEDVKKLLQDGTAMFDNWTDNKLEKLLEDIQNLPSDEEEMLALFKQILQLEGEIFDAMNVQNYEKFFYIKVGIENMLEDIKTGAYKHDFE